MEKVWKFHSYYKVPFFFPFRGREDKFNKKRRFQIVKNVYPQFHDINIDSFLNFQSVFIIKRRAGELNIGFQ